MPIEAGFHQCLNGGLAVLCARDRANNTVGRVRNEVALVGLVSIASISNRQSFTAILVAGGGRGLHVTRTSLSHRSRGDTVDGRLRPYAAADLLNTRLVWAMGDAPATAGTTRTGTVARRSTRRRVDPNSRRSSHERCAIPITTKSASLRFAIVEYRAIGDARRNLGVHIIRPEEGRLAPKAFGNRFHSCTQPLEPPPTPRLPLKTMCRGTSLARAQG